MSCHHEEIRCMQRVLNKLFVLFIGECIKFIYTFPIHTDFDKISVVSTSTRILGLHVGVYRVQKSKQFLFVLNSRECDLRLPFRHIATMVTHVGTYNRKKGKKCSGWH